MYRPWHVDRYVEREEYDHIRDNEDYKSDDRTPALDLIGIQTGSACIGHSNAWRVSVSVLSSRTFDCIIWDAVALVSMHRVKGV